MAVQTLRHSLRRLLRQQRMFSIGIVAVLAVAIGACTAIFTLMHGIVLRPLPLRDPATLVTFTIVKPGTERHPLSLPDVGDFEAESRTLDAIVAMFGWSVNLTGSGDAERLQGMRVSPDYFDVTGARVQLGRTIQSSDEDEPVVLISHGLWQRRFGGAADAVGRMLVLNGDSYAIAGILAPDFVSLLRDVEVIAPFSASADPRRNYRAQAFVRVIGRMNGGVTLGQTADDLNAISRRMRAAYPDEHGSDTGVWVRPLHDEVSGRAVPMLTMLLAAVAVMLLVACANIANLFLVQGAARRREVALRAALGASRGQIVSQLIAEAAVLATIGGALGVLVAGIFVRGLIAIGPADLPRVAEIALDWRSALLALGLSLGAGLVFGAAPAVQALRGDLRDSLRGSERAVFAGSGRIRRMLIITEVALSTVLLVAAALLGRSFQQVLAVDPGFRPGQVLTVRLSLPRGRYSSRTAIENFYQALHPRVAAIPGIGAVAAANVVPMNGYLATTAFFIDGVIVKDAPEAHYRMISPDYFRALGIRLRAGRMFTPADRSDSRPVAIINETFARQYWPDIGPIGARLRLDDGEKVPRLVDVVGVTADVKHFGLERETVLEVYVPISQVPDATTIWLANNMYWVVETTGSPLAAANAVRREIAAVDPGVPASFVRSMDQWMAASTAARRFNLQLVSAFALAALLLAVIGVYSVCASGVVARTREIGVRTALGASKGEVVGLILREGITPVMIGLAIGTTAVFVLGRATASLLFGVAPHDPASLAIAAAMVAAAALIASYVPARRAGKVDPVVALRAE